MASSHQASRAQISAVESDTSPTLRPLSQERPWRRRLRRFCPCRPDRHPHRAMPLHLTSWHPKIRPCFSLTQQEEQLFLFTRRTRWRQRHLLLIGLGFLNGQTKRARMFSIEGHLDCRQEAPRGLRVREHHPSPRHGLEHHPMKPNAQSEHQGDHKACPTMNHQDSGKGRTHPRQRLCR
jgi:hypothetical protein